MEKRLIATMVAAAFAGTAGVAVAGPISVASIGTYAAETIGAATGTITLGNVAYTLSNPFAIASTQTIKYVLTAKMNTCPVMAITDSIANGPANVVITPPAGPVSATCTYTVAAVGAVPANSLVNFTGAKADKTAGAVLAGGSPLTATVAVFDSTNTQVEGNQANVAIAAHALSAAWTASAPAGGAGTAFNGIAEASKVDVGSNPVANFFTAPGGTDATAGVNTIVLGAFSLVENGGTYLDSDGLTPVNIAALTTNKHNLTVTGPFVANTNNNVVFASTVPGCTTNIGTFTITAGSATASLDAIAAALPTTSPQRVYVCYTPQSGLGAGKTLQIPTGQFSGSATTTAATLVTPLGMLGESATGNLYNLQSNGAQVDVRVMTTAATTGWTTVLRIINTGSVAAPVTATYLNADGTVGATGVIVASLAGGATAMVSSADVEKALQVQLAAGGNPPRIRISAPTNGMRVQAWVQTPNGAWFMGTPAQGDDSNKFGPFSPANEPN